MMEQSELKAGVVKVIVGMIGAGLRSFLIFVAAIALWWWAVYDPTPYRIVAATGFSLFIFLPVVLLDRRDLK